MDLMEILSDLLPLIILIALSSFSKNKGKKKKPVKKDQMQASRQDEKVTNTKKEIAAFGLFGQLKEAFEEEMRKMEEGADGGSQSRGYKPKRHREQAQSLNFHGPKKHEDLAFYRVKAGYNEDRVVKSEKIVSENEQKSLNKEDILKGIIFAEILSPPKSKRG